MATHGNRVECHQEGCDYFVAFQVPRSDAVPRFTSAPLPGIWPGKKGDGSTKTATSALGTLKSGRYGRYKDPGVPERR